MTTKHGVRCSADLLTIKANQWDLKRLFITPSMTWLYEQVLAQDLTHLWIMRDTSISPDRMFIELAQASWPLHAIYSYPIMDGHTTMRYVRLLLDQILQEQIPVRLLGISLSHLIPEAEMSKHEHLHTPTLWGET